MRSESWLVLSAKEGCSVAGKTTENYIGSVDDVPLARNIVRGGAEGTHSKLSFFDTSLLGPLHAQQPQAAETEGEGYLPHSGGSKSVSPDRIWALIDLSLRPKDQKARETAGKPTVMSHRHHRALVGIKSSLQCFCTRQIQVVGGLI